MSSNAVTIFFDVNETLSNLDPVANVFEEIGAGHDVALTWFATVLRDGFALATTGSSAQFLDIARANARDILHGRALARPVDESVDAILAALSNVPLHDDVTSGIRALHAAGHRLFTLSNGPTSTAERLFATADISALFTGILSVEGHAPWKPARAAYMNALERTNTEGIAYLVAVHPWDIHGAADAGLSTIWLNRAGAAYPGHFHPPTVSASSISAIAPYLVPPH